MTRKSKTITDKQRQMIAGYLPHPRDPELDFDQYYVKDTSDRVRKGQSDRLHGEIVQRV